MQLIREGGSECSYLASVWSTRAALEIVSGERM